MPATDKTITVGGATYAVKPQTLELLTEVAPLEVAVTRASSALDRLDTEIAAKASRLREIADEGEIPEAELSQIEADLVTLDERRQEATRVQYRERIALVAARLDGHEVDDLLATLDLRDLPELERLLSVRPT